MNITPINTKTTINTSFGCNDSKCNCCYNSQPIQNQADTVDLTTKKKPNFIKRSFNYIKENHKKIGTCVSAAFDGMLTAFCVLGANQIMTKISGKDTSSLATKLAITCGIVSGGSNLIKNRKVFKEEKQ